MDEQYTLKQDELLGRYIVAKRDLKKGEIIFQELPLVSGPEKNSSSVCPGCYQIPEEQCSKCGWLICGTTCSGSELHRLECKIIAPFHQGAPTDINPNQLADYLMIIRCLLYKLTDPDKWTVLQDMETNWDQWSATELLERGKNTAVFLQKVFPDFREHFTTEDILRTQAALDVNAYEVRLSEVNVQAMYAQARLLEHSCVPNTHKTISNQDMLLTMRASVDIPAGTHISTSYCDVLWPTYQRQNYLQWSKFFTCCCARCADPSELGSELSSLLCPTCPYPTPMRAGLSLENSARMSAMPPYGCHQCAKVTTTSETVPILGNAELELLELDKNQVPEKINDYEKWLERWTILPVTSSSGESLVACSGEIKLHPNHSLVLDCCHTLFLLYSKDDTTPEPELKRKIQIGLHLLNATCSLLTGISKFRGTVMYELAMTEIALLIHKMEVADQIDGSCKSKAEGSLVRLSESLELLCYEPHDQPEGILAKAGALQYQQLRSFLSTIIPDLSFPKEP